MPTKKVFGPSAPTKFSLMGIRFIDGEGGSEPAAPVAPIVPEPVIPAQDPTDWKAASRKWEGIAKENKTAAAELATLKDAQKSDQQRLEDRATAAETALAKSELASARAMVALEKGLTASQAKRLVGSNAAELTADADELLADLGTPAPKTPRPDPSVGARNEGSTGSVQAGRDLFTNSRTKTS